MSLFGPSEGDQCTFKKDGWECDGHLYKKRVNRGGLFSDKTEEVLQCDNIAEHDSGPRQMRRNRSKIRTHTQRASETGERSQFDWWRWD